MAKQHRTGAAVGIAALLVATVVGFSAPRERWARLGSAHVDGKVDHDNISVGVHDGRFRAIQLRVRGGPVELSRVVVHYGNGEPEEVAVNERVPAGGSTHPIDLRGRERVIQSVELGYAKGSWRSRPEVVLLGMR
jgi:hypothetical protein